VAEIEKKLLALLTPAAFAPLRMPHTTPQLRDRLLTLPVMTAIVLSLVWRQIPSLAEVLRVLAGEGLLWVQPLTLSKQALSKRLARLPAFYFARLFDQVLHQIWQTRRPSPPSASLGPDWTALQQRFSALWIADGSTLEALKKRVEKLPGKALILAGKILMMVEAFTHVPVAAFYHTDPQANDKTFAQPLLDRLPVGGLLVLDLGFFSFPFFDAFSQAQKFFLTRFREKTSFRVLQPLSQGPRYQDRIIQMGLHNYPCHHPVRMVSVLWNQTWYHYLTNVLDPETLSPRHVCDLYRRRWRIEQAFLLTKRLLGLSYLWVGGRNGVPIQIYATWIFYAVLVDLCRQVAEALSQPLDRISVEMVFRSLYHFSRALQKNPSTSLIPFLVQQAKILALVKAQRQRHRDIQQLQLEIWMPP